MHPNKKKQTPKMQAALKSKGLPPLRRAYTLDELSDGFSELHRAEAANYYDYVANAGRASSPPPARKLAAAVRRSVARLTAAAAAASSASSGP
jgi:hypothetical protein